MENHETLEEATMCLFFNVKHKEENDFWLCNALETKVTVYKSRGEGSTPWFRGKRWICNPRVSGSIPGEKVV